MRFQTRVPPVRTCIMASLPRAIFMTSLATSAAAAWTPRPCSATSRGWGESPWRAVQSFPPIQMSAPETLRPAPITRSCPAGTAGSTRLGAMRLGSSRRLSAPQGFGPIGASPSITACGWTRTRSE